MRTIRILAHVSLDGILDDGEESTYGGWTASYRSPAGAASVAEAQGKNFDLLLGRRTYDLWSNYWPNMKGGPFADGLNGATKYVVTHRPESLAWGPFKHVSGDIPEGIRALKSTEGPDLVVWGSTTLTSDLLSHGLVDEVVLMVYPVLLGAGKRFFSDSAGPSELALVSTKASTTGALINTYKYVGALKPRPPVTGK